MKATAAQWLRDAQVITYKHAISAFSLCGISTRIMKCWCVMKRNITLNKTKKKKNPTQMPSEWEYWDSWVLFQICRYVPSMIIRMNCHFITQSDTFMSVDSVRMTCYSNLLTNKSFLGFLGIGPFKVVFACNSCFYESVYKNTVCIAASVSTTIFRSYFSLA